MINTSIGLIGVALQAAKGTAAESPTFVHGLTGGQPFKLDRTVESDDVSCGVRAGTDSHVESIVPGLDFETYGYADVTPLYFYGAMGNIASAAASTLYKHTITLGSLLPYLTFWGRVGEEYTSVSGCKIDQLELEFEGNSPLDFGVTVLGMDDTLNLEGFPGEVDPSCFDGYWVPTNGTFKLDTAGSSPATSPVTGGSLTLANNVTTQALAGRVKPGDVEEGKLTTSGSVKVKPADLSEYYKMITGSASGTTSTGVMVYGSFEWNFTHSKNSNYTMKISATNVPFTADFPEVDPAGGAAEIEFSFSDIGVSAPGGSPVTIEIVNGVESYVDADEGSE